VVINTGIWDAYRGTNLDQYVEFLDQIYDEYGYVGVEVIWVETTPIDSRDVGVYNEAALEVVRGVVFTFNTEGLEQYDGVHFTEDAYRVMADQMVEFLQARDLS